MSREKQIESALRRLIRQILREELSRMELDHPSALDTTDFGEEEWEIPSEAQPSSSSPWAVFGSPQPAPELTNSAPLSPQKNFGPFLAQSNLNPPPYIPPRNKQ
ncbi:hypothetical protein [Desmospora activa]|uniref:Uncharacterized protein n=1 Tax=Desmospora activa DSM 45169 TaxID=1121389 RepID=A0A2T4ZC74_9BACL|nr:hypothetical protein [Desmospora activa]PTM59488.1 hypothetical protein C8J48_2111 [Desmospora activa DSM 45169]